MPKPILPRVVAAPDGNPRRATAVPVEISAEFLSFEGQCSVTPSDGKADRTHRSVGNVSLLVVHRQNEGMRTLCEAGNINRCCGGSKHTQNLNIAIDPQLDRLVDRILVEKIARRRFIIARAPCRICGLAAGLRTDVQPANAWSNRILCNGGGDLDDIAGRDQAAARTADGEISGLIEYLCKKVRARVRCYAGSVGVASREIGLATLLLVGTTPCAVAGQTGTKRAIVEIESVVKGVNARIAQKHIADDNPDVMTTLYDEAQAPLDKLIQIGDKATPDIANIIAAKRSDWKLKALMCEALGGIPTPASVRILARVLENTNEREFVRKIAATSLGRIRIPEARAIVMRIVGDEAKPVAIRAQVMGGLALSGFDDARWLGRVARGETISKQEGLNQDEVGGIMWNAIRSLGQSKTPEATEELIKLHKEYPTNDIVVAALGATGDPQVIPSLLDVLVGANPGPTSKRSAVQALGKMKARVAVEPLRKLLFDDPSPFVVWDAAVALAEIGDRSVIPDLEKLVVGISTDKRFVHELESSKAGYGTIPPIRKALADLKQK